MSTFVMVVRYGRVCSAVINNDGWPPNTSHLFLFQKCGDVVLLVPSNSHDIGV